MPARNFLKIFSVIAILSVLFTSLQPPLARAQGGDGLKRRVNAESGRVSFIGPKSGKSLSASRALGTLVRPQDPAMALAKRYGPEFGLKDAERHLRQVEKQEKKNGQLTVKYQQQHENIPVMGGELIVNTDGDGDLYSINGEVSPNLSISTQPAITSEQALDTALQSMAKWYEKKPEDFTASEPELWIYDESLLQPSRRPVELTWRMEVTAKDSAMPVRELVLVNTERGGISLHFNQIDTAWTASTQAEDVPPTPSPEPPQPTEPPTVTDIPDLVTTPTPADESQSEGEAPAGTESALNGLAELAGATWYVSPTGNDTNSCSTANAPCAHIDSVLAKVSFVPNDTVKVAAGVYTRYRNNHVLDVRKSVNLSGGWNSDFTTQLGFSIFDGQNTYYGIGISNDLPKTISVSIDRFIVKRSLIGIINKDQLLSVSNSSVSNNTQGGIVNNGPSLTLNNVVVSNNMSSTDGGGIATSRASVIMNNVTITQNQARTGGGIYYDSTYGSGTPSIQMSNTIISGNTSTTVGPDCSAPIISAGNNIIGNTTGCTIGQAAGDKLNINPQMGVFLPEQGYHPLLPTSPAINAGNGCYGTTDQRGAMRLNACDIGAYEYRTPGPAASIFILSGDSQITTPGSLFATPLQAVALDNIGSPVGGTSITFSGPSNDAGVIFTGNGSSTATFPSDASGVATTSSIKANNRAGSYFVSASASGVGTSANFALKNFLGWYVATSGQDTNVCINPDTPCATLNGVLAKMASGDKIFVAEGLYAGSSGFYTNNGDNVVSIDKDAFISGGWNGAFTVQTGLSTIDGQKVRRGLYVANVSVVIENFIIQNGKVAEGDGGFYDAGGGVYNDGQLTINNSSISNNTAIYGGGIENQNTLILNNTTITGNKATSRSGGGIYNESVVRLNNTTISNNSSVGRGGGIYNEFPEYTGRTAVVEMQNSILAGNVYAGTDPTNYEPDCGEKIISLGNNIIGSTSGCTVTATTGDKFNVNPKLGSHIPSLGFLPLQTGSPAINAGNSTTCLPNDQRMSPRVGVCDIGTYEYRAADTPASLLGATDYLRLAPNTPSKTPLQVVVVDAWRTPVSGVLVTFTAPLNGPSGVFANGTHTISVKTDVNGLASAEFTTNGQFGPYEINASASGLDKYAVIHVTNFGIFVTKTGDDTNNCSTPATACATINGGLAKAVDGDTVHVAEGRYVKDRSELNVGIVTINKNVTIRGGWNPDFTKQGSPSVIDGEHVYAGVIFGAMNVTLEKFVITKSQAGISTNLDSSGSLVLDQMSIVQNDGNGVTNSGVNMVIQNTTISQNLGNGVDNGGLGIVTINNSTITGNQNNYPTNYGGGLRNMGGTITLSNSIVSGNSAPEAPDCYVYNVNSLIVSNGNNIIGTTTGCTIVAKSGDKFNTDPLLSSLLPTGYQPMLQGSPALNGGNSSTCTQKDQRGAPRLEDAKCDIGAYEHPTVVEPAQELAGINIEVQRTPIDSQFDHKLEVVALDAYGSPVAGVVVTFTAPDSGPSGSFISTNTRSMSATTNTGGLAVSSTFKANSLYGDYVVTASANGISTPVNFSLHNGAWFISSLNGNNSNSCLSIDSPCTSIQGVLEKKEFNPGETLWLAAGTYNTASNYYIRKNVTIVGGWNSSFSGPGGATLLQESYSTFGLIKVNIRNVVFQGSMAGITNESVLILENASIYQTGLGIRNTSDGNLTLINVTMSENTGTALRNDGGYALVSSSTIANNRGYDVGGIRNDLGITVLKDTILAGNTATNPQVYGSADCHGNFISQGNNIIGTIGSKNNDNLYDCRSDWSYDLVGTNSSPVTLGTIMVSKIIQDGLSGQWLYPLNLGSPAVDGGSWNCAETDQRGVVRPQGSACDIGAYEYVFEHDTSKLLITTYNGGNTSTLPGTLVCDQTNLNCTGGDAHAQAAHKYAIGTYNFLKTHHNRNSIDNAGLKIYSTVHYRSGYDNAFWNGYMMVYGDAHGFPLADDIVAHELTHGVTQYESNLYYYYQSGAINESFSDLWGEYYDQTNGLGNDAANVKWRIGEDISGWTNPAHLPLLGLRDMKDPTLFHDPDRMTSSLYDRTPYYDDDWDNGGVHRNSGVNNKAVSLLVEGTPLFNGKTVTALGWEKVGAIYYEAQTNLLTSGADYSDLYYALQQACTNLVDQAGITKEDCAEVKDALDAVEMNAQPVAGFNPDAPLCTTDTPVMAFADDLEAGADNWTFNNGRQVRWQYDSPWGQYAQSGEHFLYADDYPQYENEITDARATLQAFVVPNFAYMHFAHAYEFEFDSSGNYDGGVLEYSVNNGASWVDAGSLMEVNGYGGGKVYPNYINPLKGRSAFVGSSHGYISTRLNLASLAGKTVSFRWRMGLDDSGVGAGWWVDNIKVYTCGPEATFSDVPNTHMFHDYIEAFYDAGITTGCSQNPKKYCPLANVTRQEMAVFIERALGNFAPTPNPTGMFTDVPYPGQPASFQAFIEEFYNDGITTGCSTNPLKYCPQNNVTRGEMAVFIERALGNFAPNPGQTGMFVDVPNPNQPPSFQPFIEQFYLDGITTGCAVNPLRFCPLNKVTRQEMAVFIVRAFGIPLP